MRKAFYFVGISSHTALTAAILNPSISTVFTGSLKTAS